MALYAAKGSKVTDSAGANPMGGSVGWTFPDNTELINVTAHQDDVDTFIEGLKNASLTIETNYDSADTLQTNVRSAKDGGTNITLRCYLNATNYLSAAFMVESINYTAAVRDSVKASYSLRANGAVTLT
jgi:hypothetical protein